MDYNRMRTQFYAVDGTNYFRLDAVRGDWADGLRFQVDGTVVVSASAAARGTDLTPSYATLAQADRHAGPYDHVRTVGSGNLSVAGWPRLRPMHANGKLIC